MRTIEHSEVWRVIEEIKPGWKAALPSDFWFELVDGAGELLVWGPDYSLTSPHCPPDEIVDTIPFTGPRSREIIVCSIYSWLDARKSGPPDQGLHGAKDCRDGSSVI